MKVKQVSSPSPTTELYSCGYMSLLLRVCSSTCEGGNQTSFCTAIWNFQTLKQRKAVFQHRRQIASSIIFLSPLSFLLPLSYTASHCSQSSYAWGEKKKSVFSTECQHRSEATVTSLAWADYKWTLKVQVIHIHHLKMYQTKSQVWMKRSERKFNLLKQSKLLAIVRFECLFLIKNHFTWLSYFCRTAGILFF